LGALRWKEATMMSKARKQVQEATEGNRGEVNRLV
jgi:hypothetical protein